MLYKRFSQISSVLLLNLAEELRVRWYLTSRLETFTCTRMVKFSLSQR